MVPDLHRIQAAWPSSETDINGKDQSGMAFEAVWQTLLCKPAERCGVPFMFPLCLCPEGKRADLYVMGAIDVGCKFISD